MKLELNNGHIPTYKTPETLNQANPVQNTWYTIGTITNAILYAIGVNIEDTNETLECKITIDGETIDADALTATHSTNYGAYIYPDAINRRELCRLAAVAGIYDRRHALLYGKSIKVEIRKTTAAGAGNLTGILIWGQMEAI